MTNGSTRPTGLLLSGGRSLRMSEAFAQRRGDKGLLDVGGKPMLAHVIERLAPQVGQMVISANGDPARFASFGLPVVADGIEGYAGPLAGILAGLQWSRAYAPDAIHVVSVAADAPFVPRDLVERLLAALSVTTGSIALARSGGEVHPVIGIWPVTLADDLEVALRSGMRRVRDWSAGHGAVPVDFSFIELKGRAVDPFFNANTPEELAEARKLLAG